MCDLSSIYAVWLKATHSYLSNSDTKSIILVDSNESGQDRFTRHLEDIGVPK